MSITSPQKEKKISLSGAIQISKHSFLVFKDSLGKIFLNMDKDEKLHKSVVQNMIKSNPLIQKILRRYHIKPLINIKTLKELTGGHMNDTCNIAMGVYSILSEGIKNQVDMDTLKEASMLHDLGKVLIPSKILNKPAKLNMKERKIMNIHSTLGYELLKTQNLPDETLALIKYHHQNLKHSGYPALSSENTSADLGVQIISIADKYSALRERRVYRRKLSRLDALLVLYKEVREGKILPAVYNALLKYAELYDVA
ncbi:HD domain-containing protein [bacterium]|nr:HD domain-containing protein [bacterium]